MTAGFSLTDCITERMIHMESHNRLVLLNGPSSAGKSSVAEQLRRKMALCGSDSVIISIDD